MIIARVKTLYARQPSTYLASRHPVWNPGLTRQHLRLHALARPVRAEGTSGVELGVPVARERMVAIGLFVFMAWSKCLLAAWWGLAHIGHDHFVGMQMLAQDVGRTVGVEGAQRIINGPVLWGDNVQAHRAQRYRTDRDPLMTRLQTGEKFGEHTVAGRSDEQRVEAEVELRMLANGVRIAGFDRCNRLRVFHPVEEITHGVRDDDPLAADQLEAMDLEHRTHLVGLDQFRGRHTAHLGAATGKKIDEPFGGETSEGLTYRGAGDPGFIADHFLFEERAFGETTAEDGLSGPYIGPFARGERGFEGRPKCQHKPPTF